MQTEIAYLSRHMQQLAEQLSQEEIMCDDGVEEEEDDEEIKKLENEKVFNYIYFFNYKIF